MDLVMTDKSRLVSMRKWINNFSQTRVSVHKIIDMNMKSFSLDVLVDNLKDTYQVLISSFQDLKETHESFYGDSALVSATRSVISEARGVLRRGNEEISHYKGKNSKGTLDPNKEEIQKLIDSLQSVAANVAKIVKRSDDWLDVESKKKDTDYEPEVWKDQLQLLKSKFFSKPGEVVVETTNDEQLDIINQFKSTSYQLLDKDTPFGLVQAPVILVKHYIGNIEWNIMVEQGYEPTWFMDMYTLIQKATVLGVSEQLAKDILDDPDIRAKDIKDAMNVALFRLNMYNNSNLAQYGKVIKKNGHYYSLVLPAGLDQINIHEWSFRGK